MKRVATTGFFLVLVSFIAILQDEDRSYTISSGLPDLQTKSRFEQVIDYEVWRRHHASPDVKLQTSITPKTPATSSTSLFLSTFSFLPVVSRIAIPHDLIIPSFALIKILQKINIWHKSPDEDEHLA